MTGGWIWIKHLILFTFTFPFINGGYVAKTRLLDDTSTIIGKLMIQRIPERCFKRIFLGCRFLIHKNVYILEINPGNKHLLSCYLNTKSPLESVQSTPRKALNSHPSLSWVGKEQSFEAATFNSQQNGLILLKKS